MIIIATCVWGDWPATRKGHLGGLANRGGKASRQWDYIERLASAVERNLSLPHKFICFADNVLKVPEGIEAWPLKCPWFSRGLPKAYVYGAPYTGCPIESGTKILVFDLDTVIVGDLTPLLTHGYELVSRERSYMLPEFVPDGDLVYSLAGSQKALRCAKIYRREIKTHGEITNRGDERLVLQEAGAMTWGQVCPGNVVTYKRHCQAELPEGARVVSFHGLPLPDQVRDDWVKENWV